MAKTRKLTVEVLGDVKGLRQSFQQAAKETQTLGQTVEGFAKKALLPATAALTALTAGAVKSVGAAADFEETINKIGVVFGAASDEILKFSEGSAQALGQSRQQALDAASSFGLFGKSAGLTGDELVGFSTELVKLATDLASITNNDPSDAIEAIGAGLRGEAEPLRRFNILLDDFTLRQEAMRLGLIETTKQALTPQQKVLAAQQVILRQGAFAMDDFTNTSDGLANQQKILRAELADVQREIGERLLPFALRMVEVFRDMAKFVSDNSGVFFGLGVAIAAVSAAVIVVNSAFKVYRAVALVTEGVNKLLRSSFTKLQVSMGLVATAFAAAALVYGFVTGKKKDYTAATESLVSALEAEGDAQTGALAELIKTDSRIKNLISTTRRYNISNRDLLRGINGTDQEFEQFARRLVDAEKKAGNFGLETGLVVRTLKQLRAEVLRNRDALTLAKGPVSASAANFRMFEESSWAAYQALKTLNAATDTTVKRVGGGVSKLKQNIDDFRESLGRVREAARDNLSAAREEFADFARGVSSSITSALNFGQALQDADGGSFLNALRAQAQKIADFTVLVNRLIAAGASEAVVQQVLGAGTEAGSQIANELLNTAGGVKTANDLVAKTQSLADKVGQNAAGSFRQAGVDTATALVAGIESVLKKYTIKLRSKGLTQKQLDRLKRNFGTEVNFQFSTARAEIPALADGGVVASPTLALIGEAGPEAVIPLDQMDSMGGGGDTYVTINVSGGDPQAVVNALVRWSRANGALPSTIRVS